MRALAVLLVLAPTIASADAIVRGSIVRIEREEIYINVGSNRGIADGHAVRIKRPVSLRHPVTHALVRDWIPVGAANVTQAGSVMSRAIIGELVSAVKVGDVAEILVETPEPAAPPAPQIATTAPAPVASKQPPVDPVTAEVLGLFASQSGQPIETRIAAWEHYLSTRPDSPYAAEIRGELDELHRLRDEMLPPTVASSTEVSVTVEHEHPATAEPGRAIPLVFVLGQPDRVASAYMHYRKRGSRTYRSMLLAREHDIYLRGVVPAEIVTAPGIDYFVEVSAPNGASGLAVGSPTNPIAIDVSEPPLLEAFASVPGRSSMKVRGDYLSFSSLDQRTGDHTDRFASATIDFTYRLGSHIESLGVGYGAYTGRGGSRDAVWSQLMPVDRGAFHYGYADMEVGGDTNGVHISAGGQLIAGVGRDGFGLGVEGRLRIGERDGTNLALIGRSVSQVGFLSDIRFGARPAERLLVGISVGATDQPTKGDIGVKLGTELELLATRNLSVLLRGSWQGRSTLHGGLGAGAGVGVYW